MSRYVCTVDFFYTIDSKILIPEDSSAKITSDGLLGGNYISIERYII